MCGRLAVFDNCRGQAYDGAANMMGHISGVAKRLQERAPAAIAVHHFAHSFNQVLQDVAKQCRPVKDALDRFVHDLVKLFRNSPKRSLLLGKCAADLSQSLNDDIATTTT